MAWRKRTPHKTTTKKQIARKKRKREKRANRPPLSFPPAPFPNGKIGILPEQRRVDVLRAAHRFCMDRGLYADKKRRFSDITDEQIRVTLLILAQVPPARAEPATIHEACDKVEEAILQYRLGNIGR